MLRMLGLGLFVALAGAAGCASTAPKTTEQRATLDTDAQSAVAEMTAADSDLKSMLDQAAGYVVFPNIRQGGFIVGGAGGRGVLYEHGKQVGYAQLSQASVGAQLGGQSYAEIVVLRDQAAVDRMKSKEFDVGGQASAIAVKAGAAASTSFTDDGIAVFVNPKKGAMINVSLTGQRVKYSG